MATRQVETVSHGESLFLTVTGLKDQSGAAVADGAAGITCWFSVAKVTAGVGNAAPTVGTAIFENLISLAGYLAATGITFEAITESQSLVATLPDLSGANWYKGVLRIGHASGVQNLRTYEVRVTHEASILTTAPP